MGSGSLMHRLTCVETFTISAFKETTKTSNCKNIWGSPTLFGSMIKQGSKKVLSGRVGQVEFPSGQVVFHSHCPMGNGSGKSFAKLSFKRAN